MVDITSMPIAIRIKLSVMMFLEYFVWGLVCHAWYLARNLVALFRSRNRTRGGDYRDRRDGFAVHRRHDCRPILRHRTSTECSSHHWWHVAAADHNPAEIPAVLCCPASLRALLHADDGVDEFIVVSASAIQELSLERSEYWEPQAGLLRDL